MLIRYVAEAAPSLDRYDHPCVWIKLLPDSPLTGRLAESTRKVNVSAVLVEIGDAREEAFDKRGPLKP